MMFLLLKAHVRTHTRIVNGRTVVVKPYDNKVLGAGRKPAKATRDDRTPDMFRPTPRESSKPIPLVMARNPENYTPDLFTGKTRVEEKEEDERKTAMVLSPDVSHMAIGMLEQYVLRGPRPTKPIYVAYVNGHIVGWSINKEGAESQGARFGSAASCEVRKIHPPKNYASLEPADRKRFLESWRTITPEKAADRTVHGIKVRIENPRGTIRSKTPRHGGKPWSIAMQHDYGDIAGTKGADGDPIDAYVGPNDMAEHAYVVNQHDKEGKFNEHKVMLGFDSEDAARAGYMAHYPKDWTGLGSMAKMTPGQLHNWLADGDKKMPAATTTSKLPHEMTEAEYGETQRAKHVEDLMKELADAKAGKITTGPFSEHKSKTGAIRSLTARIQGTQNEKPERFAGDHLREISQAGRDGHRIPQHNMDRYHVDASGLPVPVSPEQDRRDVLPVTQNDDESVDIGKRINQKHADIRRELVNLGWKDEGNGFVSRTIRGGVRGGWVNSGGNRRVFAHIRAGQLQATHGDRILTAVRYGDNLDAKKMAEDLHEAVSKEDRDSP